MKKFLLFALLALCCASCSKYKYETVKGDPLKTRIYTLDNGLKVYMSVNKETPRIQTYIVVKVGGKNDPSESTGLAHYFEHLMFKGTKQFSTSDYAAEKPLLDEIENLFEAYRKTTDEAERTAIYHRIDSISYEASKIAIPNEYDKLMAAIGAQGTNAFTSQDVTAYIEDIPSNQIDNWAKIQADRFQNPVIRGFHTELETIYEEKNMSLTQDNRKMVEAMDAALFPNHPYGTQTLIGTQESLKNPSITNVKNYHATYYVPNNMAICVAGDFDPNQMIATIDKYFGSMQPNPELPKLEFEPEQPITTPVMKEVYGLEAENVMLGWRLNGATSDDADIAELVGSILYNGKAGLLDLDLNQQQKLLSSYGYAGIQPDYGSIILYGRPKEGQTLDQVRDLLLEEIVKLRNGEFNEDLIAATINNYKVSLMRTRESNEGRASSYMMSFINGTPWEESVQQIDNIGKITKDQVTAWAQKNLTPENYAIVYKRQGEDKSVQKVSAPKITPIVTNRDNTSTFLAEVQQTQVTPIEPIFVDYEKDMAQFKAGELDVLYKKNETNGLFKLYYLFDKGTIDDPTLNTAFTYLNYLGTNDKSAAEIASEFYDIACNFSLTASSNHSYVALSGLSENMEKAMELFEDLLANAQPDEAILANLKADITKSRGDAKLHQGANFGALQRYMLYGPDYIRKTTLTSNQVTGLTSEQLLAKVRELPSKQHTILYYGPMNEKELTKELAAAHKVSATLEPLSSVHPQIQLTEQCKVFLAQYDAKQLYYMQLSCRGETFEMANDPEIALYNEYFGGSMSSIVFQEMREARGLAYSSAAMLIQPSYADQRYGYYAFIATQNDKMQQAIEAFDEIINEMPESQAAFDIAKESLLTSIRTNRTIKEMVLWSYLDDKDMGVTEDRKKAIFEKVQSMTLADVKAAQEKWVKGRQYIYGILGDIKDLNSNYLKTLGPVQTVTQEDIFGY